MCKLPIRQPFYVPGAVLGAEPVTKCGVSGAVVTDSGYHMYAGLHLVTNALARDTFGGF